MRSGRHNIKLWRLTARGLHSESGAVRKDLGGVRGVDKLNDVTIARTEGDVRAGVENKVSTLNL